MTIARWDELKEVAGWPGIYEVGQFVRERPLALVGGFDISTAFGGFANRPPKPPAQCFIPPSVTAEPPNHDADTVLNCWVGFKGGVSEVYTIMQRPAQRTWRTQHDVDNTNQFANRCC